MVTHHGRYYTVENARIYSMPDSPPPILVSAFGPDATDVAARIGDGFVTVQPDKELGGAIPEERREGSHHRRSEGLLGP